MQLLWKLSSAILHCHVSEMLYADFSIQMATAKWKLAEETRQQSLEKHSSFQAEMQECSAILTELEKLLAA